MNISIMMKNAAYLAQPMCMDPSSDKMGLENMIPAKYYIPKHFGVNVVTEMTLKDGKINPNLSSDMVLISKSFRVNINTKEIEKILKENLSSKVFDFTGDLLLDAKILATTTFIKDMVAFYQHFSNVFNGLQSRSGWWPLLSQKSYLFDEEMWFAVLIEKPVGQQVTKDFIFVCMSNGSENGLFNFDFVTITF